MAFKNFLLSGTKYNSIPAPERYSLYHGARDLEMSVSIDPKLIDDNKN
jgi:hypothetical protein